MKKTIQIPEGNEFSLFIPFVVLSKNGREDASAALWNDLQVVVHMSNSTANVDCTYSVQAQYVVVSFGNDLKRSSYDVIISGEYETRKVCAPLNNHFAITAWADGNYADFVVGQPIICPTQTIIGQFNTTQDIIDLTEELRAALAAAEAAKEEYEEKVEELSDVAQQTTLTEGVAAIREDISHISIDTTTIAKQGTNASATLTATQTAATNAYASAEAAKTATIDGNDTAVGVAKEVRSEVGTGSDTASETGTLFAVLKWVKDKVKSIFNLIGSPESGQPATLFAAIAAGRGGGSADALETEVETGKELIAQAIEAKGGTATSSMSLAQLAQAIDTTPLVTKIVASAITFSNVVDNKILDLAFIKEFTGNLSFEGISQVEEIKNIPTLTAQTTFSNMFYGCSSLKSIPSFTCPNFIYAAGINLIRDCISLTSANLSVFRGYKFTSLNSAFYNISCESIDISALDTSECTDFLTLFGASPNIIKINMLGFNLSNATMGLSNWFSSAAAVTTFVGDETYDNVVNNDLKTFVGLNLPNPNMRINYCAQLNQASLRAILNGLADRTGQTSINFTMGAANKAKLSADDIAVATAKNWGIV